MRPQQIRCGNACVRAWPIAPLLSFNEAAADTLRKQRASCAQTQTQPASMRPQQIRCGNVRHLLALMFSTMSFNEAAADTLRKLPTSNSLARQPFWPKIRAVANSTHPISPECGLCPDSVVKERLHTNRLHQFERVRAMTSRQAARTPSAEQLPGMGRVQPISR